jgi:hypothetical protein
VKALVNKKGSQLAEFIPFALLLLPQLSKKWSKRIRYLCVKERVNDRPTECLHIFLDYRCEKEIKIRDTVRASSSFGFARLGL